MAGPGTVVRLGKKDDLHACLMTSTTDHTIDWFAESTGLGRWIVSETGWGDMNATYDAISAAWQRDACRCNITLDRTYAGHAVSLFRHTSGGSYNHR